MEFLFYIWRDKLVSLLGLPLQHTLLDKQHYQMKQPQKLVCEVECNYQMYLIECQALSRQLIIEIELY
jgi:hypothetical protein